MNDLLMILVIILIMVAIGLAMYFTGNPLYETIDRPVVDALAGARVCKQRRKVGDAIA